MSRITNKCPGTRTNFKNAPVLGNVCVFIYRG
nr:MAG TPA: hypothetical protein [Caudoviricetes sp.]